ncbi:hypothetical protein PG990_006609 [Apiospora arundinis]|uniref:Uncharacterized protein n=1 Tax=Apiospora arundinis TaxID=335852 RepID=A0ABR2JAP5_9PEZI
MRTRRQAQGNMSTATAEQHSEEREITPEPASPAAAASTIAKMDSPAKTPTVEMAKRRKSKLPGPLQFPLVVILSLAFSSVGYSLVYPWTKGVLADHARVLDSWGEVALLTGWRVFELALGWYGNYDSNDLVSLTLLSHGPPLYLLSAFYNTPAQALLLALGIETLSTYLPFRLLRALSPVHADPSKVHNAELLTDKPIAVLTSLLSGAIFTISLFSAYATYLPQYMVVYLNNLPSITAAHEVYYLNLLPVTLPLGFAATSFIFTPAEAEEEPKTPVNGNFDPVEASLKETVRWNLWGWSNRTKMVMKRTALLMAMTGINTTLQTALTIEGAELPGALAWSSVWVVASAVTGLALGAVGSE